MSYYYVYVLYSLVDKKLYIGSADNLERRVKCHNYGKVVSTKQRRPFKLMYFEGHLSKQDALRRERYFKTSKGRSSLKQMLRGSLGGV